MSLRRTDRYDHPDAEPQLEDFQDELRNAVLQVFGAEPGTNRRIPTLPAGAGKTRTATEALTEWLPSNTGRAILWIAQSEELYEQAVQGGGLVGEKPIRRRSLCRSA